MTSSTRTTTLIGTDPNLTINNISYLNRALSDRATGCWPSLVPTLLPDTYLSLHDVCHYVQVF